jgi:hypothetical protein
MEVSLALSQHRGIYRKLFATFSLCVFVGFEFLLILLALSAALHF